MFKSFRQWFSRTARKSRTFQLVLNSLRFRPSFRDADYADYAMEGYEKNPYVNACINLVANSCASIPPQLYRIRNTGRVERALGQYERRAHGPRLSRHKRREVAASIVRGHTQALARKHGCAPAVARRMAMKAMVVEGELEPVEGHELISLLMRPNEWYQRSYQRMIQAFVSYLEIGGEVFIEPLVAGGAPQEIYVLSPGGVKPDKGTPQAPIAGFEFREGGRRSYYNYDPDPTQSDIWYSHYFHPRNPLRGMSPLEAAAMSVDVNNEGRNWNLSLLQNGAMFSGIVTAKGSIGQRQLSSLKEQLDEGYSGASNAGKVLAVDDVEGLDFKPVSQTVRDMMWGDLNRMTAREVAMVWNVPPEMLGDESNKTYSNYQESRRAFYMEKVIPLMDYVFGELNTHLTPFYGDDLLLDYDVEAIDALQEDVNAMHQRVRENVGQGLLTINEARETLGYENVDGGDVLLVPANKIPLDTAVQEEPPVDEPEPEPDDEPVGAEDAEGEAEEARAGGPAQHKAPSGDGAAGGAELLFFDEA